MIRKVKKERINRMIWGVGVDSYNRFQTFLDNEASFDAIDEYWYAFITSYCGSDDLYPHIETIKEIVFDKFHPAYRKHMMNRKELDLFNSLPELVTLYRGMTFEERESEEFGISWSLDKKVAEFFANVYTRNHSTQHLPKMVHSIKVKKTGIVAISNGRKEQEVIYVGANCLWEDKNRFLEKFNYLK